MRPSLLAAALVVAWPGVASAIDADPTNYTTILPTLKAGDVVDLAPGDYTQGLNVTGLAGTAAAWITIRGPTSGPAAVFLGDGCCNTVEITDSSYVAIQSITVDGQGIDGVFGVSAKGSSGNVVHHIAVEGCTFVGQSGSQQTVAISTKTPTWGWIIRNNVIEGAGTGMYLGNSNYDEPFIAGLIEHNLVKNTIGYNIQIKNQNPWPAHPGIPSGDQRTIIRHNVFVKDDTPSPDGDRPNLFVGSPPLSGPGSGSLVEVYGNVFVHNVPESLVQATGRVSIHDNVFFDVVDKAVYVASHDGFPLRFAHVYDNTIHAAGRGIVFGEAAAEGDAVFGNLIFAGEGIAGPVASLGDNRVGAVAEASSFVKAPGIVLGQVDFYPLPGKVQGAAIDHAPFADESDSGCDFNGDDKGDGVFRGAYAGEGDNPGWHLAAEVKPPLTGSCAGTGGAGQGGAGGGSAQGGGSGTGASGASGQGAAGAGALGASDGADDGGCGCRQAGSTRQERWAPALALASLAALGRRRRGGGKRERR